MTDAKSGNLNDSEKTVRCSSCGTTYSASERKCPACGRGISSKRSPLPGSFFARLSEMRKPQKVNLPALIGACLIVTAYTAGIVFNISANARDVEPVPTAEIVETAAPTPVPTPTPTPTVTGIKLYAFGRELGADGFTAYVGDKPFSISAELEPQLPSAHVSWSISDSASLSVSGDSLSCEFAALKPTGKNELTVNCYGFETTIPVYLWER